MKDVTICRIIHGARLAATDPDDEERA